MITVVPMKTEHVPQVYEIEKESFSSPWSLGEIEKELRENKFAAYFVAVEDGAVIGYAGMWHIVNEGHVTNIAVSEGRRGKGVGGALIGALVSEAVRRGMIGLTLEVRVSNERARRLYAKSGFVPEGVRKNYYSDAREDAIIMWKYL
jgi:ribosomal-protein-alanine N-acetyltransferase